MNYGGEKLIIFEVGPTLRIQNHYHIVYCSLFTKQCQGATDVGRGEQVYQLALHVQT